MVEYLNEEEIEVINEKSVEITNETFEIRRPDDIRFILDFVMENFDDDIYKKALGYCVSLIVLHPFANGNHRTSIISAEHFLLKNNLVSHTNDKRDKKLEEWRLKYEEKNDLEKEFFHIATIKDTNQKLCTKEIIKIMDSKYGNAIEEWLKNNYKSD